MEWLPVGILIGFLIGILSMIRRAKEKARAFKKGDAYRWNLGDKLYVIMEEDDFERFEGGGD